MLKKINLLIMIFCISFSNNCLSFPTNSIYNLNSELVDKDGRQMLLGNLAGKIQVFSMIYTNCKTICPIIISNMKAIEKLIPQNIIEKVNFTLVTLDPDRDSIPLLFNFFKEKNLNFRYWNIYKSSKEETLKIALALGIKYKKEKTNEYTHSNLIIVLDKNGVIKMHHQGLDKNYSNIIKLLSNLD